MGGDTDDVISGDDSSHEPDFSLHFCEEVANYHPSLRPGCERRRSD